MAKNVGVWGIDIGRCALKALRCRIDGDSVVAEGFDYIEYPKLLSQPEADAPQLVKEALEQFLSRNSLKGDKVVISVSGESGLARYFKPPPVDVKKIADIVKYEARQQIPFDLNDVIWDYQRMAGGQEVDGFALDTEVGLFAMKREQVQKALTPFNVAAIEVDVIQLSPIAIYNYASYDLIPPLPEGKEYDGESPPPSTVVLSIGTDTTDLVITNGYRVWQRNIPLGGSHFTKQLSKDMKLTFAKAEHLKRNPKQADDPKAIFQAMRPVFADMVTEVQRSVGFFQSLDRKAKITGVVMLGNTVKLPGLQQYLSKHLGYDVKEVESFSKLAGAGVVSSPSFKDNLLAFAGCYGLCLQGLSRGKLSTNLIPREILTERMVRAKKPWAVAAVALLVLGGAFNYIFHYNVWNQVNPQRQVNNVSWEAAKKASDGVSQKSSQFVTKDKEQIQQLDDMKKIALEVVGTADRRLLWPELLRAINDQMPTTPGVSPIEIPDYVKVPFTERQELHFDYVESQYFPKLETWWENKEVKRKYFEGHPELADAANLPAAGKGPVAPPVAKGPPGKGPGGPGGPGGVAGPSSMPGGMSGGGGMAGGMSGGGGMPGMSGGGMASDAPGGIQIDVSGINVAGPVGPGWVIELKGHHFYNSRAAGRQREIGAYHVRNQFIKKLEEGVVDLPMGEGQASERFTLKELGISYAILAYAGRVKDDNKFTNPNYSAPKPKRPASGVPMNPQAAAAAASEGDEPGEESKDNPRFFEAPKYEFIVQFVWQEKPLAVRLDARQKAADEEAKNAAAKALPGPANANKPNAPVAKPGTAIPAAPTTKAPAAAATPAVAPTVPVVTPVVPAVPAAPAASAKAVEKAKGT